MSEVVYNHLRKFHKNGRVNARGGTTLAIEPLQGWHVKTLEVGTFFEKLVGKARCSEDDNYCKKIGRDLAQSRMKPTKLTVLDVKESHEGRLILLEDGRDGAKYYFVKYADADRVYLAAML